MKILLIDSPYYDLYGASKVAVSYYFPLGIGYLSSYLEKHGHEVELLVESKTHNILSILPAKLKSQKYSLIGISSMTSAFPSAAKIAKMARSLSPSTPIIAGGAHISGMGPSVLDDVAEFDFLCIGEGENTLLELVSAVETGKTDFQGINGLVWRGTAGKIIVNPPRGFHPNLDDFPPPARHLVNFKEFSVHSHVHFGSGNTATIVTSRGCPFPCIFCSAHLTDGRKYRFHSEDYVIKELRLLKEKYNVGYVMIEDDTFTIVEKRVKSLCDRLIKENIGITFGCFSRVDIFNEELANLLSRAGCRFIVFGIESGVPHVLEKIGKKISVEDSAKAIRLCNKYKIKSFASFVVGFPFETKADVQRTIEFGNSLDASLLAYFPFVPFPGTPLFSVEKHKPATVDGWAKFLVMNVPPFDMVPDLTAIELKKMTDLAALKYFSNPKKACKMLMEQSSLSEVWSLIRGFMGIFIRYLSSCFRSSEKKC